MLSRTLSRDDLPLTTRQSLNFQAGRLFEDIGDYDRSFEAYREGNNLKPRKYDRSRTEEQFEKLKTLFTKEFFENAPRSNLGINRPIFIVGMPRSGTSLTEQILASHPEVFGAGELTQMVIVSQYMEDLFASNGIYYPECLNQASTEILNKAAQMYTDRIDELDVDSKYVTDKMPHNFMHLGLIALLFPDVSVIHCKRDPRDTCISCYFQDFVAAGLSFAYDLSDLGHHYKLYEDLMEHWKKVLPIEIYESQYEALTTDPSTNVRKMLQFCGLDWDDRCLEFHKTKRDTKTASYDQVREPMYTKSVARWQRYEKHLGPLLDALEGVELMDPDTYLK